MSKFEIEGLSKLSGEIPVLGAKNSALKLIAATVLIKDKVILENVPDISDIETLINILTKNGAQISRDQHTLTIDTTNLTNDDPDADLVRKFRGSIVLAGPYLARFGKVNIPQPGGCAIGSRPIDDHLNGFKQVDTNFEKIDAIYHFKREKIEGRQIKLCPSVTATENMIMTQVLATGQTKITDVACEPQIADLANFLNEAGAKITGAGTDTIDIEGVDALHGLTYKVMPDPFEACTFICLAAATNSHFKITNCNPDHLYPFLDKLQEIGVEFVLGQDFVEVKSANNLKATDITTGFYPEFSTDMQSQTSLVLTQANGESKISEKLFENRLGYLKELEKMGAKIEILDNHTAQITGPTKLHGAHIESLDLRAGATLILAGLMAEGKTVIDNAEIVDRGYEKIEERLAKLGAKIKRIT